MCLMKLLAFTALILLAGCTYVTPKTAVNNSSNLTLNYQKSEAVAQEGLSEPMVQDPGLYSHSIMVDSYNSVLLYSLNQDYIKNSRIRYGLFKLYA